MNVGLYSMRIAPVVSIAPNPCLVVYNSEVAVGVTG